MLRSTRPIKVAETPPTDGQCPVKLNLLKADLVTRSVGGPVPADAPPALRRRVDLPHRKIDLSEQVAGDAPLELSDVPSTAKGGPRPAAGLGSVREFSYAKAAAEARTPNVAASAPQTLSSADAAAAVESPALARVIEAWPSLSPSIHAAILAMVEAVAAGLDAT